MKPQELELWTREIVDNVRANKRVEDSKVELKSEWPEPARAAERLAGHANAIRGSSILWIIGVDEKDGRLTDIDNLELETWYKSVEGRFDGYAPRLLIDVNVRIDSKTIVALYFDTQREAPYVVKSSKGGFPQYIVPWREATRVRAARRDELLLILIPIRRFSALIDELEFNIAIAKSANVDDARSWGCLFRDEEFHRAMRDGAVSSLAADVKELLHQCYIATGRVNQRALGTLSSFEGGPAENNRHNSVNRLFIDSLPIIEAAHNALRDFLQK